ncbi:alpha/beta fold hydrolase [Amycolatopsis thailandensis]|uniref:alpha/beta fold hydrolase n=1 Tax=Amycolatopsis thailandensis TaxID=589330 RepID=UPI00362F5150
MTLAFRETGPRTGVPVVLLHALGSKSGTWDDFASRLDRRVLAVDLPGHGDSAHAEKYSLETMADAVAELLDDQVDLVGHSMGGRVAVLLAQRLPGQVRRLVVESRHARIAGTDAGADPGLPSGDGRWGGASGALRQAGGVRGGGGGVPRGGLRSV